MVLPSKGNGLIKGHALKLFFKDFGHERRIFLTKECSVN